MFFKECIFLQSAKVGDALYNTKWYELDDLKLRKDILFIIMRCRKVMKLRGAPFGVMNRVTIIMVSVQK